jgi:hypothetical protein
MFGNEKTYFTDSPVIITVSGLYWGEAVTSPFTIVRIEVLYKRPKTGGGYDLITVDDFREDTGGQTTASFNISTALKAIWSDYEYTDEITAANEATSANTGQSIERDMREYVLHIFTEYLSSDDGGVFTTTQYTDSNGNTDIPGGRCLMGGYTEFERSLITSDSDRDVSYLEHKGTRYGDASTKPVSSPERVGSNSITSWVDVKKGYTKSIFYPATYNNGAGETDDPQPTNPWTGHAPIVLRDSQPYVDFLFTNRRGAVETCSGMTKDAMNINVKMQQYSRTDGLAFQPKRSLMAIGSDGRRSWQMSSGYVTREWAEWWTMEFLGGRRKRWWMLYGGSYVPVIVKPAKNDISIYDKSKQQMAHIDFTVTLALEG